MITPIIKFRIFLLGVILAGLHTALFFLIVILVACSGDSEAGMAYYIFYYIDYPLSRLSLYLYFELNIVLFLIGGGLLWFLYGFALQSLLSIRSLRGLLPFGASLFGIALLFALPEFALASMPEWKRHWERGTEARNADDIDRSIEHISKAANLAPVHEPMLDDIWDFLGQLYKERKDYDKAEEAFLQALRVVTERSDSHPADFMNCHNQLGWLYERAKKPEQQAKQLHEAIKYNRLVYKGESTQEASCWHRLAEIAYAKGEIDEAFSMQIKAIGMESNVQRGTDFSLNYMKEQLEEWKAEQAPGGDNLKVAPQE